MFIERTVNLSALLAKKSHFLFGPRGTGKSRLIKETFTDDQIQLVDLLSDDVYSRLIRRPSLLGEMALEPTKLVVIDEVQKIPALLDEVHRLIENQNCKFLLTGSSARKLRHGGANLLGGRAWEANLFPLTYHELGKHFTLGRYLECGGLPSVYFSQHPADELKNYIKLYIKEEIQAESGIRKLDHFLRFLDVAALCSGKELNLEAIASDSGVPARTISSYLEILSDTLIGILIPPFSATKKRKAIKRSKFYIFDVGVGGALTGRGPVGEGSEPFGVAFEHFIAQELRAFLGYSNFPAELNYWRTTSKDEVDFVIGKEFAVEVKSTDRGTERHLGGLKALQAEKMHKRFFLVSRDPLRREVEGITLLHWKDFLDELWSGKILA